MHFHIRLCLCSKLPAMDVFNALDAADQAPASMDNMGGFGFPIDDGANNGRHACERVMRACVYVHVHVQT